ncbi:hypothetical protein [Spirosoma migulaei]
MNTTSTGREPKQKCALPKTAFTICAIAGLLWGPIMAFSYPKPETTPAKAIGVGQTGIIRAGMPGGITKDDYDKVMIVVSSKNQEGLNQLVQAGKAIWVDNNTKVRVIAVGVFKKRVRLLSGNHKGAAVWVPNDYVESEK